MSLGGRPWRDPRDVLNGILWILRTGAAWADLPRRYPPYQTCHRRFQKWEGDGTFEQILKAIARDLYLRGKLDLTEAFIDGTHAGSGRPPWLSNRRLDCGWSAGRNDARPGHPSSSIPTTVPRTTDRRSCVRQRRTRRRPDAISSLGDSLRAQARELSRIRSTRVSHDPPSAVMRCSLVARPFTTPTTRCSWLRGGASVRGARTPLER